MNDDTVENKAISNVEERQSLEKGTLEECVVVSRLIANTLFRLSLDSRSKAIRLSMGIWAANWLARGGRSRSPTLNCARGPLGQ